MQLYSDKLFIKKSGETLRSSPPTMGYAPYIDRGCSAAALTGCAGEHCNQCNRTRSEIKGHVVGSRGSTMMGHRGK